VTADAAVPDRAIEALTAVGLVTTIPAVEHRPSRVRLFRFSAVTWNAHRIHYDEAYARSEGHDGVVVQSTLRGQQLLDVVLRWLGERGAVTSFAWRNLRPAYADTLVVCHGRIADVDEGDGGLVLRIELEEHDADGAIGASGSATVALGA
jgi:hydroxyacyl-ACP dehydratase HTD2-like protein with hotdog domain